MYLFRTHCLFNLNNIFIFSSSLFYPQYWIVKPSMFLYLLPSFIKVHECEIYCVFENADMLKACFLIHYQGKTTFTEVWHQRPNVLPNMPTERWRTKKECFPSWFHGSYVVTHNNKICVQSCGMYWCYHQNTLDTWLRGTPTLFSGTADSHSNS